LEGSRRWPDEAECLAILRKAGCSKKVIEHQRMVERIAVAIARKMITRCEATASQEEERAMCRVYVDLELVRAGALLHDIGRGRTHGIRHAVAGGEMAREMGLPEELVLIIERHIGAGVERDEAVRFGLPPKDYLPLTIEEKIVAHADNLAGPHGKIKLAEVLHDLERKGASHVVPRMEALHRDLGALCGEDIDEIEINEQVDKLTS
jgi:uncharacterized protein (TIGR00295 family)